ncbi:hypothetical protein N7489_001540 [Penicillium chrysogenum]|uniref:uncharacterized protein n=1 Tax=Penicillium chrysogenum TaxID=5076 RepID=UPI0024DF1A43|nr:uncharacterized protein N7489_001540 [Penicillium chrysogenum]KAJ5251130.1 hypothetical protein N7489_001540 [Penicillium chrysogenum]
MKPIITALVFLLPAFSPVEAQQEAVPSSGCMEALAGGFGSFAYFPGNSNLTVWDEKQQEAQSACRVQPTTTEDVSNILHILLDASCRFAVKGGGHARDPDDSVSVGGVTIDMQKMRSIDVSADRLSVKLGSGHVLHSMYVGLENYNLTTLGGRVADVGLGGFALGGGFSALSPMYGLAMDNIFEYELVLPNATVRTINDQTHPDLYFALRGGMNNFGIVTHFTIRAVPQGQMHGGSRIYSVDKREDILEQAYQLTTTWKNDTAMAFYYRFEYDQEADDFILGMNQEYAHPISNPRHLDSVEGISPSGGRNLYATVTYYPSADLDRKMQDILMEEIQPIKDIPGFTPSLVIQPLYEAAIRANSESGGSAAGIEADGPLTGTLVPTVY